MNWEKIKGRWNEIKGKMREEFGELTDDDFAEAAGERDQLIGKLQQRYGYTEEQAARRIDEVARATID